MPRIWMLPVLSSSIQRRICPALYFNGAACRTMALAWAGGGGVDCGGVGGNATRSGCTCGGVGCCAVLPVTLPLPLISPGCGVVVAGVCVVVGSALPLPLSFLVVVAGGGVVPGNGVVEVAAAA